MFTRKVVTASVAALAAAALSVPVVSAQTDDPGTGEAGAGSLDAGSLDVGSLGDGGSEGGGADGGGDEGGLGDVPDTGAVCELPDLGGSVAKFYPLFGLTGVPSGVVDLVTSALGSFPNLLDVVAGEGGGAASLGQTGSLTGPLCTSIFGGEVILPPVTVIVDADGNPLTTVTGTPTRSAGVSTSTQTASPDSSAAGGDRGADGATPDEPAVGTGAVTLATSVPTP